MDFAAGPRPKLLGVVLLAAGFAALVLVGWLAERWAAERSASERAEQLALAAREAAKPRPVPVTITPGQRRQALANAELQRPWLGALRAVESTTRDPVFLLALALDPTTGILRLDAESSSFDQALAYVERIARAQVFSNAALLSHETAQPPAPAPSVVRFSATARWTTP